MGHLVRWLNGEGALAQAVHDAADALLADEGHRRLEAFADDTLWTYGPIAEGLHVVDYTPDRRLPIVVPPEFAKLGDGYPPRPELRAPEGGRPTAFVLSWRRRTVIVYTTPPASPPEGKLVRTVSPRTHVVACELRCDPDSGWP